jgi:ubiquinone/menaquinone biosynthesis C-methylase UbiE
MTRATPDSPWWVTNYQDNGYAERYGHHDGEVTRREIAFLIEHARIRPAETVIDLCCAFGRHLRELARLGYARAAGADLSATLLHRARQDGRDLGLNLPAVRADVRALPFRGADVALLLFGSFGFLDTDLENQGVLGECVRILRPGGRMCMDVFTRHPDRMKPEIRTVTTRAATITQDIGWDPARQRMTRQTRTLYAGGADPVCTSSSVRLYTPAELLAMLRHAGLDVDATFGSYRGHALTADSDRIVVIGHRP